MSKINLAVVNFYAYFCEKINPMVVLLFLFPISLLTNLSS